LASVTHSNYPQPTIKVEDKAEKAPKLSGRQSPSSIRITRLKNEFSIIQQKLAKMKGTLV